MTLPVVDGWPDPNALSKDQLVELVMALQGALWAAEDDVPYPTKEWDNTTLDAVAEILVNAGLRPEQ